MAEAPADRSEAHEPVQIKLQAHIGQELEREIEQASFVAHGLVSHTQSSHSTQA
jgi:hypothetical protein